MSRPWVAITLATIAAVICAAAMALGYPHGERCMEDRPCWDCTTMGNGQCGPGAR